ncbi:hypothetical protein BGZ94_001861 [Podila epigama]|nr:hypothetical protein BGZ94_001861 [Podila epigama]
MSAMLAAPKPLPPLTTSDPRSFYTIVVSGENFPNREEYTTRVMYIDRNPDVFRDIVKHLQGYYVAAKDEIHLENLMMDAYFFKLKRLINTLREIMFFNVGGTIFKVSRDTILNDGPNFFRVLEPFSDRNLTPTFLCRSPDLFKDILSHLQGYEIHIRDRTHRNNLLKEARYYKLNNLISKLSLGDGYVYSGFPTKPAERVKPEVTVLLKNIKYKHVLVKGSREVTRDRSKDESIDSPQLGASPKDSEAAASTTKEEILKHNQALVQSAELQDILYKPTADSEPLALSVELSSIELFAIWPGSVSSSMLGDQHLLVYRDQDLNCLIKICRQLALQVPTMAANIVQLSPHIYFVLDGQPYKGHEELEPIVRKLALSSAQVTPPGRALRLVLNRALAKLGCKSGQLVVTIVKAEGWSSNKEYNACRKYLTDDMRDIPTV